MTEQELQKALQALFDPPPEVTVSRDGRKLLAVVVSPSFERLNEGERQSLVWGHLMSRFSDDDLVRIEFVFTNTPEESKELAS